MTSGTWDGGFLFQQPAPAVPAAAIVVGDFSVTPKHPEYPCVAAWGLVDVWQAAGNSEEGVHSFPDEGRIDHVFITPDLTPRVKRAWIDHGTPASDHWPVFVEFA